jgi:antitoxin component of RelBE/YafQ-DinJ toxin-antitoxin module
MDTTTLQVPLPKTLKQQATNVAHEHGFSSLQEVVRFILTKFANREIGINLEQFPDIKLSTKNEKRYIKMTEEFNKGNNVKSFDNIDDLMTDLIR